MEFFNKNIQYMPYLQYQQNINISLNDVLKLIPQLDLKELEDFAGQVGVILAQKKMPEMQTKEAELLFKINHWIDPKLENRYDELYEKLRNESIVTMEYEELLQLIDIVENQNVERMKYLIELAKIREISLEQLMENLKIVPPTYA